MIFEKVLIIFSRRGKLPRRVIRRFRENVLRSMLRLRGFPWRADIRSTRYFRAP
jgi:hypothetical protein